MVKKYTGNKNMKAIRHAVIENGWPWYQDKFDQGSDYVTFGFMYGKTRFEVVYNTFNGRFLVRNSNGNIKTEESTECDKLKWYSALLDFIYTTDKKKEA